MSIKYYRKQAKLTQEQLAKEIEVDQGAVSNWEIGKSKPLQKYRRKMAAFFGVTVDELMADETAQ